MLPFFLYIATACASEAPVLFYWKPPFYASNFGDALSPLIVERILGRSLSAKTNRQQFLAAGSILHFGRTGDIVWGSGVNAKISPRHHRFKNLDVRAVRGPRTRCFLEGLGIPSPEVYGDPALLIPLLFPELKPDPVQEFILIPNINEMEYYNELPNVVFPTEDCMAIVHKILQAKKVIAGSLHALIVAESFGIPAIFLRLSEVEPLFKYQDYYEGTGRCAFPIAFSLEEALQMEPAPLPFCDLEKLLNCFPYDKFY